MLTEHSSVPDIELDVSKTMSHFFLHSNLMIIVIIMDI